MSTARLDLTIIKSAGRLLSDMKTVFSQILPAYGNVDRRYNDFLYSLHRHLLSRSDYMALCPTGSQFKGYANEASDFDVCLIAGNAHIKTEATLQEEINSIAKLYNRKGNSPRIFSLGFFEENLSTGRGYTYQHCLWPLAFSFIGRPRYIYGLKMLARRKHQSVLRDDPDFAQRNIDGAIESFVREELGVSVVVSGQDVKEVVVPNDSVTVRKMTARGLTNSRIEEMVLRAIELWRQRICTILACPV